MHVVTRPAQQGACDSAAGCCRRAAQHPLTQQGAQQGVVLTTHVSLYQCLQLGAIPDCSAPAAHVAAIAPCLLLRRSDQSSRLPCRGCRRARRAAEGQRGQHGTGSRARRRRPALGAGGAACRSRGPATWLTGHRAPHARRRRTGASASRTWWTRRRCPSAWTCAPARSRAAPTRCTTSGAARRPRRAEQGRLRRELRARPRAGCVSARCRRPRSLTGASPAAARLLRAPRRGRSMQAGLRARAPAERPASQGARRRVPADFSLRERRASNAALTRRPAAPG